MLTFSEAKVAGGIVKTNPFKCQHLQNINLSLIKRMQIDCATLNNQNDNISCGRY